MLWTLAALFFGWLALREIRASRVPRRGYSQTRPVYKPYLFLCIVLSALSAWQPIQYWRFERLLSSKATQLADGRVADVHCNSVFDTMMDSEQFAAGHANIDTGHIVFQHGWCASLMDYVAAPQRARPEAFFALHLFTHESMHVRGERNEAQTECQAIQRDVRAAMLLGVPEAVARKQALDFYLDSYMSRREQGWMSAQYFSDQCAPGKAMDEVLSDSTWLPLYQQVD
ncbi:MAG: hypothetical protein KGZ80_04830 [Methylomonas sp.]|nr:hypothetical protein [Methylomonas sp.]PPD21130.1 MAG: hypothetical protein CTY23_06475 [Methylomonas sp.]PPD27564.1 MAG: hypothetical protein CTY22_01505 [Methylomonas sp.]PPD39560.1 MAG: hypothetical protein CTY21_01500 [Methylomonas sp.]PPD55811.1 MAG: hypothetical protein CTY11_00770 [Methylomonas sp.]